jgi:CheY-like chemotaxis protein
MEEEVLKARKLESIGILAGGIAHDFNNILSALLGNLELAAALLPPQEEKPLKLLTNAQKATSRAAKLTQQLLTFSKGGDPVKEATSLPLLITESADFVLHGSQIYCEYDFPKDLWLADADTGQLSQVIQNIILNAKHAMPSGGVIRIAAENIEETANEPILCSSEKQFIKICITDSGIGIPAEIIDKVFDPYFTTKQEGSGLGLAISHSIIKKHDGQITVQSHPGEGTTFCIFIPKADPAMKVKTKRDSSDNHHRPLRVMVMDDEEMIRSLVSDQLKILGHEPFLVKHGEEALQQYKILQEAGCPVDVVIMDLTIRGGMGGVEASRLLLELDSDARLVVTSGYSNDPVISHFQDYGIRAAIIKPFNMASLEKAISMAMLSEPKSV